MILKIVSYIYFSLSIKTKLENRLKSIDRIQFHHKMELSESKRITSSTVNALPKHLSFYGISNLACNPHDMEVTKRYKIIQWGMFHKS